MSRRHWFERTASFTAVLLALSVPLTCLAAGEQPSLTLRVNLPTPGMTEAPPASLGSSANALLVAASRNTIISVLVTGVAVVAILSGTVGLGTVAAYLLHRTTRKKGPAIAALVVMIICAAIIAFTLAPQIYMTVNAWLGRE
jgi:hypothetical protein